MLAFERTLNSISYRIVFSILTVTVCFLATSVSALRHSSTSQSVLCRSRSQLITEFSHLTVSPLPPAVTASTIPGRQPTPARRRRITAWMTPIARNAAASQPISSMSRTSTWRQVKSSYQTASWLQLSARRYHASCSVRSAIGPRRWQQQLAHSITPRRTPPVGATWLIIAGAHLLRSAAAERLKISVHPALTAITSYSSSRLAATAAAAAVNNNVMNDVVHWTTRYATGSCK